MSTENLAARTKVSPRFENDILCFYEGDTFDLQLDLNITRDDEPVEIQPEDVITIEFVSERCKGREIITSVEFTDIQDNQIILSWDSEMTSMFPKGKYTYRMKFNSEYITTLVADSVIWVS